MRVLLLEDENIAREFFVKILLQIPEVSEVFATSGSEEAISLIHSEDIDLALVDIELDNQELNGIQVARRIVEHNQNIFIVFITGYAQYALDSFIVHPYDYILKPVNKNRLVKLIQEINAKKEPSPLFLRYGNKVYQISPYEIIFVEKSNNAAYLHTTKGIYKVYYTLQELENLLGNVLFRSHRSYLINPQYLDSIIPNIGRSYQVNFLDYKKTAVMSRQKYKEYRDQ
ncbi:MAG: response regulator transcription factor [Syntrophomonadaceae bacterium]|nr:response regulator transcription factor [Syntrophomonadaceae bacterium]